MTIIFTFLSSGCWWLWARSGRSKVCSLLKNSTFSIHRLQSVYKLWKITNKLPIAIYHSMNLFQGFFFYWSKFFYWFILLSTFELLKRQIWSSPLSLLIYSVQVMASNSVIKIFRFGSKVDNLILPI